MNNTEIKNLLIANYKNYHFVFQEHSCLGAFWRIPVKILQKIFSFTVSFTYRPKKYARQGGTRKSGLSGPQVSTGSGIGAK